MIVIRRTSLIRFLRSKWTVIAAAGIGVLVFIGCGQATPEADDFMVGGGGKCTCNGTALHCDAQNDKPALDVASSEYCSHDLVESAGSCSCQGTSLVCNNIFACVFQTGGCFGFGSERVVTVCNSNGFTSLLPGVKAESIYPGGQGGVITFLNDAKCAGGQPPPPPPPSGGGGGGGGGGGTCTCQGVDYVCNNPNGSVKSVSYNATECGGSGACNCREPNKTLACPDGTYADFNPQCTGSGNPTGLCGNGVCDPDEPATCAQDCPKP